MTRIPVPSEAVRTREAILAGQTVTATKVWITCHNCGGRGTYPSSAAPAGWCRLYCWQDRNTDTFGKLPMDIDKYVKKQQAADRAQYRALVQWELDAPKRAEAERVAEEARIAERLERQRREEELAAKRAVSQHLGVVGERLTLTLTVRRVSTYEKRSFHGNSTYTAHVVSMVDAAGNVVVWFADYHKQEVGAVLTLRGTVKAHDEYKGERQTVLQRVTLTGAKAPAQG